MDLLTNMTISLAVFLFPLLLFLFQNSKWIIIGSLLVIVIIFFNYSFNKKFQQKISKTDLGILALLMGVPLFFLPLLWGKLIMADRILVGLGKSLVAFGENINIVTIFVPLFIISLAILFFVLFQLLRYFIVFFRLSDERRNKGSFFGKSIWLFLVGIIILPQLLFLVFYFSFEDVYIDNVPRKPVEEIIIRTYGDISEHLIDVSVEVIEEKTGIRAVVEESYPGIEKETLFYNPDRKQFDADRIWEADDDTPGDLLFGSSQRIIRIVDVDLYTEIQPERPYVFSRSMPNVQTVLISVYRLQKESDEDNTPASLELVASRMRKLVLHTLSWSVALQPDYYFENSEIVAEECVTLGRKSLEELDESPEYFSDGVKKKDIEKYFRN